MPKLNQTLPPEVGSEDELEALLAKPSAPLIDFIQTVQSPLLILGAGGKMGPTLALLAKNAATAGGYPLRVIAVSRFSDPNTASRLDQGGVEIIRSDLLDRQQVRQLPDSSNILYLVGLKFGTTQNPSATWAINTLVPAMIAERFPSSRIVALSTGNVYPPSDVSQGGSIETDPMTPVGEYANAAVARERIFEFYSRANQTPMAMLRLFYAVELRYGVLVDIARKVHTGEPLDLSNGHFNCIWQGDANEMVLRALSLTSEPPSTWNLCRPETFSVRKVAEAFGELFGRAPIFTGQEGNTALLGNSTQLCSRLGTPAVTLERMLSWIAGWVKSGGRDLGKPTHFESRDGRY